MAGSTFDLTRKTRRILLPCVAAAALIVPAAAQGILSAPVPPTAQGADQSPGNEADGFSPPAGATLQPLFSPPPGATLPPGFPLPSAATPPRPAATPPAPAEQPRAGNPTVAPAAQDGFDLSDAGIGAAIMAGAGALLLAAAAFVLGRRRGLGASHS